MIDIHSHIMYETDDGCKTKKDALETIKNLEKIGFKQIVLTPHYINRSNYCKNNKEKKKKFKTLENLVKKNNIDVKLYLGNEIFINENIDELISNDEICTINNTNYILIELPLNNEINNASDYLYELKLEGYIPIIAHPERYGYFQKKYDKIHKLYDSGVLFQCNYESIIGSYGNDAKKALKYMLKNNMVSFMATDIHNPNSYLINNFNKVIKKLKKIVDEDTFLDITNNNALKMLNNEIIE